MKYLLPVFALACLTLRAEEASFRDLIFRAEAGDVSAETQVGIAYCNGTGVARNYQQAYTWLQKAAEANSPMAKSALGWLFDKGYGVPQNDRQAFEWYLAGAKDGDSNGQDSVGQFYATGRGVDKNDKQAAAWFAKSAAQGNLDAENRLGAAYQVGWGVEKNSEKAFTYFLHAASHNFAPAQYNLALCYWHGVFVPRDPVKAYGWCSLAARTSHDKQAEELFHELTKALTGAQLEAGEALAASFIRGGSPVAATRPPATLFASGRSASMPFDNVMGHIVITAKLEGHPDLRFIVDTGASASFLDQKTAAALNIEAGDNYTTGSGIGKDLLLSAVTHPLDLELPGLDLAGVPFRLFSSAAWDRPIGIHVDGILGTDILKQYALHIDYRHNTVSFMDPATVDVMHAGDAIPIDFRNSLLLIQARISKFDVESNPTPLIVDTGSNESITLSGNFFTMNPGVKFSHGTWAYSLGGGGSAQESITRCAWLRLGDVVIKTPFVHILQQNQGMWANGWAGSIGNDILKRFDVTINIPGRMLYLRTK